MLYLVVIATAFVAEMMVRSTMVVSGDAVMTAHNIAASLPLYRLGGAADLVNLACDIALAIILYDLLKPVDRTVAMMAAVFQLIADACLICATVFHFAAIYFLGSEAYLHAFDAGQLLAMLMISLRVHDLGYNISLIFFAIQCVLLGGLIIRSTFLPRTIGYLFVATGLCYLTNSFTHLMFPGVSVPFYLLLIGLISESALMLWLIVFGVNLARWRASVSAGVAAIPAT